MIGTTRKAVVELVQNDGNKLPQVILFTLYGYRAIDIEGRLSFFQIMCGRLYGSAKNV